jgi:hypothetical protein
MQDEIVAHLARQLDTALVSAEARRAAQLSQPDSIDLYFQGMALVHKGIDLDSLARAGDFFARALALDPEDVGADWQGVGRDAVGGRICRRRSNLSPRGRQGRWACFAHRDTVHALRETNP